jgi:hypothetical protein
MVTLNFCSVVDVMFINTGIVPVQICMEIDYECKRT